MLRLTSSVTIVAVLVLFVGPGCNKPEPRSVQVGSDKPIVRPLETLKPVEPAEPIAVEQFATSPTPAPTVATPAAQPLTVETDEPATKAAKPITYTVKKKDTLWSIAKTHLGNGHRWREIVALNPGLTPQKLLPNTVIKLPPK